MYNDEKRVAYRLKEHDFSLDGLPADTVAYYTRRITGSMGKPYRFLTDALEMFKTTGIASDIADKQIVIDLLRCYNELGAFDNSMNIYYDQRMKAILPEQMGETLWSADTNIDKVFGKMLASKKVRNWLLSGMRASSSSARPSASTVASGTARAENVAVFFAASRKAEFLNRAMKLSRNTNSGFIEFLMTE